MCGGGGGGVGGGGGRQGVGGGELGGNCGTGVRASISKPTPFPFIYIAFEKQTHSYTRSSEMLTHSYTALFCTHLLLVVRQISQSIY